MKKFLLHFSYQIIYLFKDGSTETMTKTSYLNLHTEKALSMDNMAAIELEIADEESKKIGEPVLTKDKDNFNVVKVVVGYKIDHIVTDILHRKRL